MQSVPRSFLVALAGVVGVVALAAALATPDTPVTASVGSGGGRGVARVVVATAVLLALAVVPLLLLTLRRETPTETVDRRLAALGLLLLGVLVAVVAFLLANASGGATRPPAGGGGGPLGAVNQSTPDPSAGPGGTGLAGLAVVGAVGLAGAGLLWLRLRTPTDTPDGGSDEDAAETRDAVAATAGAAAERLAAGDRPVDNVVYGAWREMTAALDVGASASTTPGEFAAAAVDAGFDPDAVAELTDVFETVRYGDDPPAAYADRAQGALERIEATADGGSEP